MKHEAYTEEPKVFMEKKEGNLTKIENSLNKSNPKMQLILEGSKIKQKAPPMKLQVTIFFINFKYSINFNLILL